MDGIVGKIMNKEKLWNKNFINACIANFFMASSFHLLMPTIPIYLTEQLNIKHSQIGIVLSSYALAMLMARPFSGYIIDVFNRKKILLIFLFLFIVTFAGYLFAISIMAFMLVRFVHGLFWGVSTVASNTVAIDIIPATRRAEGIGYFGMNMNLAMAIAPFIAIKIYEAFGFHILVYCAIGMGILSLIAISFIQTGARIKPIQLPPLSFDRFILIKGLPIFFNQVLVTIGWGTLISFGVIYGKEIHISNAGMFFLLLAIGLILSRITAGRFVDRGHVHTVIITALCIISLSLFSFATFHSIIAYCTSAFFIGIGYGTMLPAFQTAFINMAPHDRRGTANSTYLTAFDFGLGIGMLLGGFVSEHYTLSHLYYIAASLSFIAIWMYIFVSKQVYNNNKLQ